MTTSTRVRATDSAIPAAFSAVINGATAFVGYKGLRSIPLSLDTISSSEPTVWAQGVSLAFMLACILTCITAFTFIRAGGTGVKRPSVLAVLGIALRNGLFLFGTFVTLAVLWQRAIGTVTVTPGTAAVLVGFLAAVVTVLSDLLTKRSLVLE